MKDDPRCPTGVVMTEGEVCHGLCPSRGARDTMVPCLSENGEVKCSNEKMSLNFCRGKNDNAHCPK